MAGKIKPSKEYYLDLYRGERDQDRKLSLSRFSYIHSIGPEDFEWMRRELSRIDAAHKSELGVCLS